jgi:hypothetical protein
MATKIHSLLKMKPALLNSGWLFASGTTVPTGGTSGYQTGAIFQHTDGGATTSLYVNEGTDASCSFVSVTEAANAALLSATAGTVSASKAMIPDAYKTLRWGGFNTGAALTLAVPFASVPNTWADGQLDIHSVFGGTGTDLGTGYSAKVARFRHVVLTSTGTVSQEVYGAVGQLVVRGTTLTQLGSGLMGTFEGHTSGVVLNSSYTVGHAAVTARLGGHAAITATTPVAGFLAFNNGAAALAGGKSCAFAASSTSASYPWTLGIYMPVGSIGDGIRIGNWASAGGTGQAIAFTVAAQNYNSDGQLGIVSCFGESTVDLTNTYQAHVGRYRHLVSGSSTTIAHETYGLVGQLVGKSVTLTHLHAGLLGTLEANTTAMVSNGAYAYSVAAVMGRIGGGALITATKPVASFSAILNGAAISASGKAFAYAACGTSTGTFHALLAADKCDRLLYAATGSAYECGVKVASITSVPTATGDIAVKLMVNTTEYYLIGYAAGGISGI